MEYSELDLEKCRTELKEYQTELKEYTTKLTHDQRDMVDQVMELSNGVMYFTTQELIMEVNIGINSTTKGNTPPIDLRGMLPGIIETIIRASISYPISVEMRKSQMEPDKLNRVLRG